MHGIKGPPLGGRRNDAAPSGPPSPGGRPRPR
jgi:hypothetical protein